MRIQYPYISGIHITKKHRNAGFVMPEDHFHPYFELYYVHSGKCCFFLNDTLYSLSAGDFMLIAPGDLHHTLYTEEEDCERFAIYYNKEHVLEALIGDSSAYQDLFSGSRRIPINPAFEESVSSLLERMLAETRLQDAYTDCLLSAYLHQLFCLILRCRTEDAGQLQLADTKDTEVLLAAKYIYRNFAAPLRLAEVAGVAGLSPTYFSKKFKQVTGIGFKEYVNFVRMKNAALELLSTDHSITEIALNNGFTDGNYFKDSFKKIHGCSPREYRRQN